MDNPRKRNRAFLPRQHDHGDCPATALEDARAVCVDRGVRLTPTRQRVLEILWQNRRPLGAYEILKVLSGEGYCSSPPTAYRALEFLVSHGLVHRLPSLNAFVGCSRPGHSGAAQFLLCTACGMAAEINDSGIESAIERGAAARASTAGTKPSRSAGSARIVAGPDRSLKNSRCSSSQCPPAVRGTPPREAHPFQPFRSFEDRHCRRGTLTPTTETGERLERPAFGKREQSQNASAWAHGCGPNRSCASRRVSPDKESALNRRSRIRQRARKHRRGVRQRRGRNGPFALD